MTEQPALTTVSWLKLARTVAAGLVGAVAMLAVDAIYPTLGYSRLDLPTLASFLARGDPQDLATGLALHFGVSLALALVYVYGDVPRFLPGAAWLRGTIFGSIVWVLHTVGMMPVVGLMVRAMVTEGMVPDISFFIVRVGLIAFFESLAAHLAYGAAMGAVSGEAP